jgi:hypothetical protein
MIERHEVSVDEVREDIDWWAESEQRFLTRVQDGKVDLLGGLANSAFMHAHRRAALGTEDDLIRAWDSMLVAAQAGVALFAAARTDVPEVEVILGEPVRLPTTGPNSFTYPGNWVNTFYLAVIRRDMSLLDTLCDTPIDALRLSSTKSDEFSYLWVDALRAYWLNQDGVIAKVLAAMDATLPEHLVIAPQAFATLIAFPAMSAFFSLVEQDGDQFDLRLAKAVDMHKRYWSTKSRDTASDGYLALGPLAMACIAHDLGLPVTVTSDYMPTPMVEGAWRTPHADA